ncbi:MAG: hypothetical protein PVH88_25345 [Ignavibacteria bacterium]|jgi:hypothetical protein
MKNEYDLDYSKAKPNRFADVVKEEVVLYPIDEDVAKVFRNAEEANNALRAIINVMTKKQDAGILLLESRIEHLESSNRIYTLDIYSWNE